MRLTGKLKEKVEKAKTREEAKRVIRETIEEAGIILDDDELNQISGGGSIAYAHQPVHADPSNQSY